MFNLEQSIADWRKQMLAAGIRTPALLDELESHLREEFERQIQSGASEQEAFQRSVLQIGQAKELKAEFVKNNIFDLEQSIEYWRRHMFAAGIKATKSLDELENHLREEVEEQIKLGQKPDRAFEMAADQIGGAAALKAEFAKVDGIWPSWQKIMTFLGFNKIPAPDFAPAGMQSLGLAAGEARNFCHDYIGTEHILLGLFKSESTVVSNVVRRLGVDEKAVRIEIGKFVGNGPVHEIPMSIPYTPRAKNALQLAGNEARALNQQQINPEHILLGLIREGDGIAWRALKNLGIRIEDVRRELLIVMGENRGTA
ncbi:MAG TPA: Clp protease N-terminal domain-containing protein [Candidatus Sulfotelmatobacter sp.]|nr:Clp protease N-terminal domain-containing protein [Candidatus Sulfotelmatobacter sp.]